MTTQWNSWYCGDPCERTECFGKFIPGWRKKTDEYEPNFDKVLSWHYASLTNHYLWIRSFQNFKIPCKTLLQMRHRELKKGLERQPPSKSCEAPGYQGRRPSPAVRATGHSQRGDGAKYHQTAGIQGFSGGQAVPMGDLKLREDDDTERHAGHLKFLPCLLCSFVPTYILLIRCKCETSTPLYGVMLQAPF